MQFAGEDPERLTELRNDERQRTVYRPALIETEGFAGFCMVRNLSKQGMKADAYAEFAIGQRVVVELSQVTRVDGEIIWSDGSDVGVRFDNEVDVVAALTGSEGIPGNTARGRPPRLSINCAASIVTAQGEFSTQVSDVSQRGLKLTVSGVRGGDELTIRLPHHSVKKAIVRWTQDGTAGLNFVAPMKYSELAEWAIRVQNDQKGGHPQSLEHEKHERHAGAGRGRRTIAPA
ncbi:hypothetical protein EKN06_01715 [Croceicoccus ponticola]|uniref:PilZ domain-containing protein n=1 Tax=Croceicoccus ponticola TaxID=2217664 RepID=A0A437H017_9SPHN|nr:PilZ domain-containing protein [Croceicoccus ponticola]RVQ68959.1 hypothetical protein EKN06_01715 [Croceicoccus ponticola]